MEKSSMVSGSRSGAEGSRDSVEDISIYFRFSPALFRPGRMRGCCQEGRKEALVTVLTVPANASSSRMCFCPGSPKLFPLVAVNRGSAGSR